MIGFAIGVFLGLCLAAGVLLWRELKANEAFMETLAGPVVAPHCARCAKGAAHCREEKAV